MGYVRNISIGTFVISQVLFIYYVSKRTGWIAGLEKSQFCWCSVLYLYWRSGWVKKSSKPCWRNIWMVSQSNCGGFLWRSDTKYRVQNCWCEHRRQFASSQNGRIVRQRYSLFYCFKPKSFELFIELGQLKRNIVDMRTGDSLFFFLTIKFWYLNFLLS